MEYYITLVCLMLTDTQQKCDLIRDICHISGKKCLGILIVYLLADWLFQWALGKLLVYLKMWRNLILLGSEVYS